MDILKANQIIKRHICEVAGTIQTNGIQELDKTERGGVSQYGYVRAMLVHTSYNALRALPGFNYSINDFFAAVEAEEIRILRSMAS